MRKETPLVMLGRMPAAAVPDSFIERGRVSCSVFGIGCWELGLGREMVKRVVARQQAVRVTGRRGRGSIRSSLALGRTPSAAFAPGCGCDSPVAQATLRLGFR